MVRPTTEEIEAMIQQQIDAAYEGIVPEIVQEVGAQLTETINARLATFMANLPQQMPRAPREFQNRDFTDCRPAEFRGGADPIASTRWLAEVEGAFETSRCPNDRKVVLAKTLLKGAARDWWAVRTAGMEPAQVTAITWAQFVEWFNAEFTPRVEVERISLDFQNLKQTTESVQEMNTKFIEMARFCPLYAANEDMKIARYLGMLREDIREFVSLNRYTALAEVMEAARRRELFLASSTTSKRKEAPIDAVPVSSYSKKKRHDHRGNGKKGESSKGDGDASGEKVKCYRCKKFGHRAWECPEKDKSGTIVCFECGKQGHIRRDCPQVKTGAAPGQLRITDGRPVATARVLQLTAEEAQASGKVVTGTTFYSFFRLFQRSK